MGDDPFSSTAWARIVLHGQALHGHLVVLSASGLAPIGDVPTWASDHIDAEFNAIFGGGLMKFSSDVSAAIVAASTRFGVEAPFLAAIIAQESGGDTFAMRYEKSYAWMYDIEANGPFRGVLNPDTFPAPDGVSSSTEWIGQHCSWGLGQVMGATAREMLYPEKFFTGLCLPETGSEYCARLISRIKNQHKDLDEISCVYNHGHVVPNFATDPYVVSVRNFYAGFQKTGF